MKKAIITRANSKIQEMIDLVHPYMEKYADFCGADFIVIDSSDGVQGHPHYSILKLKDYFNTYDRIFSIDTNVLIMPDCPNIFEKVDFFEIGSVFEDKGTRLPDRRNRIGMSQKVYGDVGWGSGYINTGVFILSSHHKSILNPPQKGLWLRNGYDDVMLGWNINLFKFSVKELSWKWNCMSMWEEPWFNASRFDSYIIHYTGNGFKGFKDRLVNMKEDYKTVYGE